MFEKCFLLFEHEGVFYDFLAIKIIKRTKTRRKVLKVAIERAKVEKLIVDHSRLSISVNCQSQLIVDLSQLSINES